MVIVTEGLAPEVGSCTKEVPEKEAGCEPGLPESLWAVDRLCESQRLPLGPRRFARVAGHKPGKRYMSANELRVNLGVVPLETTLFSGGVYDNLLAANSLANFADIVTACKQAEMHESIEGLPQGYQTQLGEHEVGLSGGPRQRIAISYCARLAQGTAD